MIKMAFCEEVRLTSGDVGYEETAVDVSSSNGNLIITRDAIFQLFNLVHEKVPFVSGGVCKSGFWLPYFENVVFFISKGHVLTNATVGVIFCIL